MMLSSYYLIMLKLIICVSLYFTICTNAHPVEKEAPNESSARNSDISEHYLPLKFITPNSSSTDPTTLITDLDLFKIETLSDNSSTSITTPSTTTSTERHSIFNLDTTPEETITEASDAATASAESVTATEVDLTTLTPVTIADGQNSKNYKIANRKSRDANEKQSPRVLLARPGAAGNYTENKERDLIPSESNWYLDDSSLKPEEVPKFDGNEHPIQGTGTVLESDNVKIEKLNGTASDSLKL